MRAAVLAGLIIAMSGQCFAQAAPKVDERRLRTAFEAKLKDAESARFRAIKQAAQDPSNPGIWDICGEVNAKNSFGAYEGFQPFMGMGVIEPGKPLRYAVHAMGEFAGRKCEEKQLR